MFGREIIGIFTSDSQVLEIAYNGLNLSNLGFFVVGLNLTTTVYYQSIEVPKYSNMICILRSIVFLPISAFVLGKRWGINGIWLSLLSSEFLSLATTCIVASVPKYTNIYVAAQS